ncbi:ribonuclease Z [Thiofilum flexile]|uniref:ribonuclease Z n=1 Tax=Thiofilum flexile TaxID=125627 RepID=UPI000366CCD6|nr:ribonuclease Z [Thiofilum flexile]
MYLSFLGTSSGTPTKQRNVTGITLQRVKHKRWYLIDCGEGTQHQLLHTSLSLRQLQAILITHVHGDHCYGLPGLLASATLQGRTKPLLIIAPAAIQEWLHSTLTLSQTRLSYTIEYIALESVTEAIQLADFQVQPIALSHRVLSYAFRFEEYPSQPTTKLDQDKLKAANIPPSTVWGRLQSGETVVLEDGRVLKAEDYLLHVPASTPKAMIIGGDNDKPELLAPYLEQVSVVVHEATYVQAVADKVGPTPQHSTAKQVAEFAERYQVPNLVLTHFSPRYSIDISPIVEEATAYYHGRLFLAADFQTYQLNAQGILRLVEEKVELSPAQELDVMATD